MTSYNDADAVYSFLTEHLGYRPDNIIDLRDAKKADLEEVFGAEPGFEGELARLVQSQPNAKVLVYYSGHGATDGAQSETYLAAGRNRAVPRGGQRLQTVDALCQSRRARRQVGARSARDGVRPGPRRPCAAAEPARDDEHARCRARRVPALTVLAASDRGQRTLIDRTYDIGLFTRYLIEGLAGGADLAPVGNDDGKLDSAEIYVFTAALRRSRGAQDASDCCSIRSIPAPPPACVTSARGAPPRRH